MKNPSAEGKAIARSAVAAFGGRAQITRYWDDRRASSVDIVACQDSPCEGVTSYATVGVWEAPLMKDGKEIEVRTELVGACASSEAGFANYLSTAAFFVINSGRFVAPGVVFPDVLSMYDASATMKHLLFLPPFLWDGRLPVVELGPRKVAWLLAIPISDAELGVAQANGVPALEQLFEEHQIDIFDLARASVV